jgi:hypothetical protein
MSSAEPLWNVGDSRAHRQDVTLAETSPTARLTDQLASRIEPIARYRRKGKARILWLHAFGTCGCEMGLAIIVSGVFVA